MTTLTDSLASEQWPFGDLTPGGYGVILSDPPWSFKAYSPKGHGKSAQSHYSCMTLAEIQALPVAQLAAPDAVCVMWATAPMVPEAIDTMKAWGFTYKSFGSWGKRSSTGEKWAFGTGYIYRSAAEFWALGTRGKPKQKVRNIRNFICAPVREHSRKPDQMRSDIERQWPGPYVELFARETAPGWSSFGNQVEKFSGSE